MITRQSTSDNNTDPQNTYTVNGTQPGNARGAASGMARMLAGVLCSDHFFSKGPTPAGYVRNEMNSSCYAELAVFEPPEEAYADPAFPGEQDFMRWEYYLRQMEESLRGLVVRKTAVSLYPIFIVAPVCLRGAGGQRLYELLQGLQKRLEQGGYIAEAICVDPGAGKYSVISGRRLDNKNIRQALERVLSTAGMSTEAREWLVRDNINELRRRESSISVDRGSGTRGSGLLIFLIAVNVLIFAVGRILKLRTGIDPLVEWGIQDNFLIMQGEWWRLISSMFLHADLMHLLGNMLFLYMLGDALKRCYSNRQLGIIYFTGGLAGNLLGLMFSNFRSLGASGAILGLGGALLYRMTLGKDARAFRAAGNFTWLAISVLYNLVYGLVTPGIDNYGHFGGFIGGFIVALLIGVHYDIRKTHK